MLKHLADKGVPFVQNDPLVDPQAGAEIAARGVLATSATVIDGEVVTGFEPAKMVSAIGGGRRELAPFPRRHGLRVRPPAIFPREFRAFPDAP